MKKLFIISMLLFASCTYHTVLPDGQTVDADIPYGGYQKITLSDGTIVETDNRGRAPWYEQLLLGTKTMMPDSVGLK